MSEGRIVLVDDEEMVTQNLEMLLSTETGYESVSFNQPASALEYLKKNKADVVLSDFIMPEMNGLDLLAHVKEVQPTCSRLLLTGYADKESAIRAINEVGRRPTVRLEDIAEPLDPSPFGSPVERAEHKAEVERLRRELLELSPTHREVLLLRFRHGLSQAEIAKALGKREEAVRALQYRALRQLRRRFEESQ